MTLEDSKTSIHRP